MPRFDVAIVGAGPAGTAAAFDLLEKGLRVLILDKTQFPRKKACAGGITPKAYQLFKYDITSIIKRECRTLQINPKHGRSFLIKEKNPLCYMTKREDLDLFSLNTVIEKGAVFKVIGKIISIRQTNSQVEINTEKESFKASYLIGADGANSIVRRYVSRRMDFEKQSAIEADVKIDRPDRVQMVFDFSVFKNGYFWIFPKDDHVNIGMYSVDSRPGFKVQHLFDYAAEKLHSKQLTALKGYPICTGGFKYRACSKRILLAGDAAGMGEKLLGEGIYFAVKSGQTAAGAILASVNKKDHAGKRYLNELKKIQMDLKLYQLSSTCCYRLPLISFRLLSFPFVHKRFSKGYADAKPLTRILLGR